MESTESKPFQFFCDFFQNGISAHRNIFLNQDPNYESDYLKIVEINKNEEYIKSIIWEEGEGFENTRFYKDVLKEELQKEVIISLALIKSRVREIVNEGKSQKYYLESVMDELNELKTVVQDSVLLSSYDVCTEILYEITLTLIGVYPNYLSNNKTSIINESVSYKNIKLSSDKTKKIITPHLETKKKKEIKGFQWKDEIPGNTLLLFECLKNVAIQVESGTLDKLKLAFSGKEINEPLEIRWTLNKSGKYPKPPLIRIFDLLINELKIVNPVSGNSDLAKKLEYIFVDQDGNKIENIVNVISDVRKTKKKPLNEQIVHNSIIEKFIYDKTA